MSLYYIDSSALAKLVTTEPESDSLREFLDGLTLVSSVITRVEVMRTARRNVNALSFVAASALSKIDLLPVDDQVVSTAAYLDPPALRTLDALHVATALTLGEELTAVVTYDARMQEAAAALGMPVAAPA